MLPLVHPTALLNMTNLNISNQLLEQIKLDQKKGADTHRNNSKSLLGRQSVEWRRPMIGNHFHLLLGQMGQITGGKRHEGEAVAL